MDPEVSEFIRVHRVARLATVDDAGSPHVIPVCYAFDGERLYTALDLKPKRVEGRMLKRVRNILENPRVSLVIDDYSESWSDLAYVLIHGVARIVDSGEEQRSGEGLLRSKYPQYRELLKPGATIISITPDKIISWGRV
ncbi:MAG: TIGR03668 family PPOX class F420-dependent oxidoreductase [Chloroflexi bacterium]|nr:TIGR03668 family PPOX class F420-dependent oxidoreductase [Chloroflexota bacterium]